MSHPSERSCLAGLVLGPLPTKASRGWGSLSSLQRGELQAGDGAKVGAGWGEERGRWSVDWQELEGTAKAGVEWGTAEQRDRTVQGSEHPCRTLRLVQHGDIQLVPFLVSRDQFSFFFSF